MLTSPSGAARWDLLKGGLRAAQLRRAWLIPGHTALRDAERRLRSTADPTTHWLSMAVPQSGATKFAHMGINDRFLAHPLLTSPWVIFGPVFGQEIRYIILRKQIRFMRRVCLLLLEISAEVYPPG